MEGNKKITGSCRSVGIIGKQNIIKRLKLTNTRVQNNLDVLTYKALGFSCRHNKQLGRKMKHLLLLKDQVQALCGCNSTGP